MQLFHSVLYRRGQHLHFYITIQNLLPVQGKLLLLRWQTILLPHLSKGKMGNLLLKAFHTGINRFWFDIFQICNKFISAIPAEYTVFQKTLLHCLCKVFQTKVSITMTIGVIIRFKIIYIDKQEYPRLFLSKLMFNICPESSAIQDSCQCIRTGQTNISFFIFFYNILLFSYISLSA